MIFLEEVIDESLDLSFVILLLGIKMILFMVLIFSFKKDRWVYGFLVFLLFIGMFNLLYVNMNILVSFEYCNVFCLLINKKLLR